MNTRYNPLLTACAIILFSISTIHAQDRSDNQEWKKYDLEYRKFQVSIIPGIGTNGLNSGDYVSKYSFNLLAGYNGALDEGFELGAMVNANKYYANGVQLAGLTNYSGESTAGIQIGGIGNYSGNSLQGIQMAGIGNWANADIQGLQFSGIFNVSGGNIQGLQTAGMFNVAKNDMQGLLLSGVGNISGGHIQGLLFSGLFNIARNDMQGITASGILNYSKNFQGISLSSINTAQNFQGIQFGLANISDKGQGVQAGLVNYANSFEGVPVGLISYYKNGRHNLDVWSSESGFTNIGMKLGTNDIYNMLSIGFNPFLDRDVWQLGWSIGKLNTYDHHFLYSDFSYFKINEGGWTSDLNSKYKYRLLFGKEFADDLKLYGGPTLNMLISRVDGRNEYTQYRIFDFGAKGREYIFWAGFSVGVELF